ncbi:MAG: inorganic diphosphatase [Myxococcota bacterium]|nr:inorganic diphosphatase [Myxococcota bacterium]
MKLWLFLLLCLALCLGLPRVPLRAIVAGAPVSRHALALDGDTVLARYHLSRGYPARNRDGSVNAVIEIPSGTTAKFDVDEEDGSLRWARRREDGARREVDYLSYPVNYGMVPRTLAADGDPLDVLVLGRGIERASVVPTRVIGVLKMAHDGTRDDKLIAVPLDAALRNGFSRLRDLPELDDAYPAARVILVLWFSHYWGRGATEVVGWGDAAEARTILEASLTDAITATAACTARPGSAGLRPRAASPCDVLGHAPSGPRLP